MQNHFLTNHLLIAMPQMHDSSFEKTVTLICEHNADGALGLIINRPIDISLGEVMEQMELDCQDEDADDPVLIGGPVASDRGFVLHRIEQSEINKPSAWDSSLDVSEQIRVTTSRDILLAIAAGKGPKDKALTLGYAGWEAGQLEEEMLANAWLTTPCDERIVFDTPYAERWDASARLIGVDLNKLSGDIGHA